MSKLWNVVWIFVDLFSILLKIYFRLGKGAYAHVNKSVPRSVTATDLISVQTIASATPVGETTTSTDTNVIVPTRLRLTDKRLLRKIHSTNSIIPRQDKSKNFNEE